MTAVLKSYIVQSCLLRSEMIVDTDELNFVVSSGMTSARYFPGTVDNDKFRERVIITHTGNMGSSLEDIKENLRIIFNMELFEYNCLVNIQGTPDNFWECEIDLTINE